MNPLICVDVGNSTIAFGIFKDHERKEDFILKKIPSSPTLSAQRYKEVINNFTKSIRIKDIKRCGSVLSSVVPKINPLIIKALKEITEEMPLVVNYNIDCGIRLNIKNPERIGSDRIANAVAAFNLIKKDLAVVDLGTATTITIIENDKNCFPTIIGGAIMPGLRLMEESLHKKTAKLPLTKINIPKEILGKDTVSAINSGVVCGTAGAIEKIIKAIEKEKGFRLKLILTGGYAKTVSPFINKKHTLIPDLIFEGLRLIYLRAKNYA
jgi:type III pantothenate kinase